MTLQFIVISTQSLTQGWPASKTLVEASHPIRPKSSGEEQAACSHPGVHDSCCIIYHPCTGKAGCLRPIDDLV